MSHNWTVTGASYEKIDTKSQRYRNAKKKISESK